MSKLNSPMDVTLLRRFAQAERLDPGELLYEMMRWVGEDLLEYLKTLRERLTYIGEHGEVWALEVDGAETFEVLFMPRTDPLPTEPSMGLGRYLDSIGESENVAGQRLWALASQRSPATGVHSDRRRGRRAFCARPGIRGEDFGHGERASEGVASSGLGVIVGWDGRTACSMM